MQGRRNNEDVITMVAIIVTSLGMKMDRLFNIRRKEITPFIEGHCHLCNQTYVRVKPLQCGKHNYCRMCQEFSPRIVRGDFSCPKCYTSTQSQRTESLETVDKFLADQTSDAPTACSDVIAQFDRDEDDDNSDLEGGNTEWDYLLQSVNEKQEEVSSSSRSSNWRDWKQEESCSQVFSPIPRKSSYIRLGIPSASDQYNADESKPSTSRRPISKTVTELLNPPNYSVLPVYIPSRAKYRQSSSESEISSRSSGSYLEVFDGRETTTSKVSTSTDSFKTDPEEIERGTSPCKTRRQRYWRRPTGSSADEREKMWLTKNVDSYSDIVTQEIGHIEGPVSDTDTDVSIEALADEKDDFWDI